MTDWPEKPSVFTPFARRFTDEHARDLAELRALYEQMRSAHDASRYRSPEARLDLGAAIYGELPDLGRLFRPFVKAIDACVGLEKVIFEFPEIDWNDPLSLKEHVDLSRFLRAKQHFLSRQDKATEALVNGLARIFASNAEVLPKAAETSLLTVPLIYALPEPKVFVDKIIGTVNEERYADLGIFAELRDRLYRNMCSVIGVQPYTEHTKSWKYPQACDLPLDELVHTYLQGTPFLDLYLAPVPLHLGQQERFSHMHVVGGSGAGKTTLLQNLILHDLQSDDPPSLVIVDSQGDLISKLSRLALFAPGEPLAGRVRLITPKDTKHPPAINIFAVNQGRLNSYDEATKEQITAGVIQTFDYLFAGLLGADLTAKQGVFFRFVARLMLSLPETMGRNATVLDMIALMDDATPYREAIERLPPIQRAFFERDFASKTFAQTKEQIRYRLNAVLENPTLARLFTAPDTRLDLFQTLNEGGIILVDTAKDFLKGSSANYGRIFISLVLQAILERAAIPEEKRRPTYLIVDEAAAYFDSNIDDLLTEARKYKCGCIFAHQFLDQATASLRASLAANTAIKMAGGVSTGDARSLATDMRTTPDFLLDQPKLHFACHIRHVTPNAVSVPVRLGLLEAQPVMSPEEFEHNQKWNRCMVSATLPVAEPGSPGQVHRPPSDPAAASENW